MTTGEKIKALRVEKKLTQAELTDGIITRNMLSQIENGLANPSIGTLRSLAERLGVPLEYLLSEEAGLSDIEKLRQRDEIKKLFSSGDMEKCLSLLEKYDDDESLLLSAVCCTELGRELMRKGKLFSAREYFSKSAVYAEKSVFAYGLRRYAEKNISLIDYIMGRGEVPTLDYDEYGYISSIENRNSVVSRHVAARRLAEKGDVRGAAEALRALLPEAEEAGAVCRYYVLSDLEGCLKAIGDIAGAYECAEARLALKEEMNR